MPLPLPAGPPPTRSSPRRQTSPPNLAATPRRHTSPPHLAVAPPQAAARRAGALAALLCVASLALLALLAQLAWKAVEAGTVETGAVETGAVMTGPVETGAGAGEAGGGEAGGGSEEEGFARSTARRVALDALAFAVCAALGFASVAAAGARAPPCRARLVSRFFPRLFPLHHHCGAASRPAATATAFPPPSPSCRPLPPDAAAEKQLGPPSAPSLARSTSAVATSPSATASSPPGTPASRASGSCVSSGEGGCPL